MPAFLDNAMLNTIFLSVFIIAAFSFLIYAVLSDIRNRKTQEKLLKTIENSQRELFSQAASDLACQLRDYTDSVLAEKINTSYKALISKELLPSVNHAADRIKELSECVSVQQQDSLEKLAEKMVSSMVSPAREYIQAESEIVAHLNKGINDFSEKLLGITEVMRSAAEIRESAALQAQTVNSSVSALHDLLTDKIHTLGLALDSMNLTLTQNQSLVAQNSEIALSLADTARQTNAALDESHQFFLEQNKNIAGELSNSVSTMKQNTELAARQLMEGLYEKSTDAASASVAVLAQLQGITERIERCSEKFSNGIEKVYSGLCDTLQENLSDAGAILSESVSNEYQKISQSAEKYADTFSGFTGDLGADLAKHLSNLHAVTDQLNHNINLYKTEMAASSQNFKLNMDDSISAALGQMDHALAGIVERLVDVTLNIQEAADALPSAVKALQREGKN